MDVAAGYSKERRALCLSAGVVEAAGAEVSSSAIMLGVAGAEFP
jgi:hypothetical protein